MVRDIRVRTTTLNLLLDVSASSVALIGPRGALLKMFARAK